MQAWSTVRAQGMRIPSGGTLVVGREQDCMGGCFDSAQGAAGDVQQRYQLEYGAQDFTGEIDELRIWNKVRTESEIKQVRGSALCRGSNCGLDEHVNIFEYGLECIQQFLMR